MPLITKDYNSQVISINDAEDKAPQLKINDQDILFTQLENGRFHSDYIPYQDFVELMELAEYIIDHLPNLVFAKET